MTVKCSSCGQLLLTRSTTVRPRSRLDVGAATSAGRIRKRNEDSFLVQQLGHVGDCRVYHYQGAGRVCQQVTRDHTLVARMVDLGKLTPKEARNHPARNEVDRAIGRQPEVEPSRHQLPLTPGDWLIVACD